MASTTTLKPDNPSFVLTSPQNVTYENRPIPELSSPHDVLVNVKYTGICGSDVHYWVEGRIGAFVVEKPMVLGHESSGIVVATGSAVTSLRVGDRVALEPGIPCRRCVRCKAGTYNLCADVRFAATPPIDGTLARYYVLPEDFCVPLPPHVSLEEGALVEPLAVGVHVVRQAGVRAGDSVVVFGAGPVGLLCMAVARAFGASRIVVVDVNARRVEFARSYVATDAFAADKGEGEREAAERLVRELALGEGADVAIDASGAEPCVAMGVHCLRAGGTFCQAGMGKPEIRFPIMAAMAKEIDIKVSFRYKEGDYKLAVGLIAAGKLDVKPLISDKVKFEDAERAFGDTKTAKGIKILIAGPE